jgi:hypothetical protein
MTRHKHTHTSERRGPLGTATALEQHVIPLSDATPAKLLRNPKLTVQLSERELKDAQKKAQKTAEKTRSTS